MGTIIFEAEDKLTEAARERAEQEHLTLDEALRRLLADYVRPQPHMGVDEALAFLDELDYVRMGDRRPTRDEMNAR